MDCWGTCNGQSFIDDCGVCACNNGDLCWNALSGTNTNAVNEDNQGCGCFNPQPQPRSTTL
jgi:hypothetical protein